MGEVDTLSFNKQNIISFNPSMNITIKDDRVLLVVDSKWIIISHELFSIIKEAESKLYNFEMLIDAFDNEDKEYVIDVLDKLDILGAFNLEEEKDYSVYLYYTESCNLRCNHCSVSAESKTDYTNDMSFDEIKKAIDKIISINPSSIVVTGGEPLYRKDWLKISKYLREKYDGKISLMTNGTLINKYNINDIIQIFNNIDISVDGVDEESCSRVRGSGVFTKVMQVVKSLQKLGFYKISLSMIFDSYNNDLKEQFFKLNENLNTFPIPRLFIPIGRGKDNREMFIDNEDIKKLENETYCASDVIGTCGAIKSTLAISSSGEIFPCSLLMKNKYKLGSISAIENLSLWIQNKKYSSTDGYANFQKLLPENNHKCSVCEVRDFCWDCLEVTDRMLEDQSKFERRCIFKKDALVNMIWG